MWLIMALPALLYAGAWGVYFFSERDLMLMNGSHGRATPHPALAILALGIRLID